MDYVSIIAKLLVGTFMLVVYARMGGRSQIHPLSGTEVVSSMVVGAMISGSLFDDSVPFWAVGAVVLVWSIFFLGLRKFKSRFVKAEKLIDGQSVQLMKGGRILIDNFNKLNLSVRDFQLLIHQESIQSLTMLENVRYEANGKLTIEKKGDEPNSVLLIERGQIVEQNLEQMDKTSEWLMSEVEKNNVRLKDIYCGEWYNNKLVIIKSI